MNLALPGSAPNTDAAAEYEQHLLLMATLVDETKHWTRELQEVWPALELVWAPENVTHPALVPGRFHILERRDPPTPPNVLPLTKGWAEGKGAWDDTEYVEPGSWMFDALRRGNHWNAEAKKDREKAMAAAQKAAERARAREAEERATEIDERIKALMNPGISMANAGKGWTYRTGKAQPAKPGLIIPGSA